MIKTLNRDIIGVIVVIALLAMSPFVMSLVYSYTKTNKVCPLCKTRNPNEYLLEVSTFGKPE